MDEHANLFYFTVVFVICHTWGKETVAAVSAGVLAAHNRIPFSMKLQCSD